MSTSSPQDEVSQTGEVTSETKSVLDAKPESPSRVALEIMDRLSTQGVADRVARETKKILKTYEESHSVANAFMEVAAERTRADNIWCGINGVGTHIAEQQFFSHLLSQPNLTPDQTLVYSHMRDQSRLLRNSRDVVRRLLIADAASDPSLYTGLENLEKGNAAGGLDASRTKRRLDDEVINRVSGSVEEITANQTLWLKTAQSQEQIYQACVPEKLREPLDKEFFSAGGNDMRKSIETLPGLHANQEALITAYKNADEDQYAPNLFTIVDQATLAQGYLEFMHYYGNLMLLKAFEQNGNKLMPEQKTILSPHPKVT